MFLYSVSAKTENGLAGWFAGSMAEVLEIVDNCTEQGLTDLAISKFTNGTIREVTMAEINSAKRHPARHKG